MIDSGNSCDAPDDASGYSQCIIERIRSYETWSGIVREAVQLCNEVEDRQRVRDDSHLCNLMMSVVRTVLLESEVFFEFLPGNRETVVVDRTKIALRDAISDVMEQADECGCDSVGVNIDTRLVGVSSE